MSETKDLRRQHTETNVPEGMRKIEARFQSLFQVKGVFVRSFESEEEVFLP